MKRKCQWWPCLIIGSQLVFYVGCTVPVVDSFDPPERFASVDEVETWLNATITPTADLEAHGIEEFWQYPEETYNLRTGDCEDIALLALWFVVNRVNVPEDQVRLAIIEYADGGCHAVAEINGTLWETFPPYPFESQSSSQILFYTYDQAMRTIAHKR